MTQLFHRLDENTTLPFKVILPLLVSIISATVWIQSTLTRIELAQKEFLSRSSAAEWRNQFADQNKTLTVPYYSTK